MPLARCISLGNFCCLLLLIESAAALVSARSERRNAPLTVTAPIESAMNVAPRKHLRAYSLLAFPSTMYILAPRINPTWRSNMATKKKAAKKKATKKKAAKKK